MSDASSASAGLSNRVVLDEVPLAVERVHVYTDSDAAASATDSHTILDLFDREPSLADITAEGKNIFVTPKPLSVQLGEDVRRLWAERGDFSRFRSSALHKRAHRLSADDSSDQDSECAPQDQAATEAGISRETSEKIGGTIAESQFVELRNQVLANLDVAHFNSIHAHQLLGMLIKQHRSTAVSSNNAGVAMQPVARMASPAPSVGALSNRSASITAAQTKAPLGIFSHLNHASTREEEFVLDPLAIALSRTALNTSTAVRHSNDSDQHEQEQDEFADPTSAEYALKQAQKEIESTPEFKENELREFRIVLETKRKALEDAAQLLSSAATELRSSQAGNRERWRSLIGLHGRGWGMTPGRPLLDVERFGVGESEGEGEEEEDEEEVLNSDATADDGEKEAKNQQSSIKPGKKKSKDEKQAKAAGLQGFGTPIITSDGKVKEEGARDAWIGFGLPEAPIELRRRSLAYWADVPSSVGGATTTEEVRKKLVFPDRMHRRLRVRFVLWPRVSSKQHDEGRIEWTSDPTARWQENESSDACGAPAVAPGQILDQELQQASREATDELVFGDVVAQARLLPPMFGVRLTSSSVRLVLTKRLDCVVELVRISDQNDANVSDSGQQSKDDTEEKMQLGGEKQQRYSPHASLLLAFLRMGPLRKYHAFVNATEQARRADAAARAAAIKAIATAKPKKSTSAANTATATATGNGAASTIEPASDKGGIAAGGRSTSAALSKLDSIGPIVVTLHYWSFVHRLGSVLKDFQETALQKGIKVVVQLVPITLPTSTRTGSSNLAQLTSLLSQMMDATPSLPYRNSNAPDRNAGSNGTAGTLHSIYPTHANGSTLNALQGHAKVWIHTQAGERLVCSLTFGQPSLVSVQFAGARAGAIHRKTRGVTLTNKPLAVDLDALAQLMAQQLGQYL